MKPRYTPPQELQKKDWGDHPKEKPVEKTKNDTNIQIDIDSTVNRVYFPPVKIYNNVTIINNNVPQKPGSNLKIEDSEENLGQSETRVTIGETITLAKAIEDQEFGRLLHNPIVSEPTKIRQIIDNNLTQKIEVLAEEGAEKFERYLSGDSESILSDACALVLPQALRGLSGEFGLLFGSETIRLLSYYFTSTSMNTFVGVSDSIPINYKIVQEAPVYNEPKDTESDFRISNFDDIKKLIFGELDNNLVFWESYLKNAIDETYDKDDKEEIATEANSMAELFVNLLAQSYRRLGLDDYPFVLPRSLTEETEPGKQERTDTSDSLADFLLWQLKAFDGVLGQFPINIEIQDNDLIQVGDQPIDIKLPNLAETLAELTGKSILNEALVNALLTINLKIIAETGSNKQTSVQNYYLLTAIQEYLGFKTSQKTKDLDLLFNPKILNEKPEKQTLSKALENSTIPIPIEINDDEDSLEEQLKILVEAARITKAVHWRGVDPRGNIASQLKSIFSNAASLLEDLDIKSNQDLDNFLDSLEKGFSDKSGLIDATKPFGREYNRRPKARNLNNDGENNTTQ